ncbi:MAG: hypothetical protein O3B96_02315, partial [bacterium]|nr:hypothetical protein [bacterium]
MGAQREWPSLPTRTLEAKKRLWEQMLRADDRLEKGDHDFIVQLRNAAQDDTVSYWDLVALFKGSEQCNVVARVPELSSALGVYTSWCSNRRRNASGGLADDGRP